MSPSSAAQITSRAGSYKYWPGNKSARRTRTDLLRSHGATQFGRSRKGKLLRFKEHRTGVQKQGTNGGRGQPSDLRNKLYNPECIGSGRPIY
jgi:hypothetical protein